MMQDDLVQLGLVDEDEIVLDEAALSLALLDHADTDLTVYYDELESIAVRLAAVAEGTTAAHEQAVALSMVFAEEFGFAGDAETYDDPANADLIRVIDRRRGLPVSLAILYVAAARRLGWSADVLDVPGHVLVLIGSEAASVIVDPFRRGSIVDKEDLAAIMAAMNQRGQGATRSVAAMPNRAVLVRLLLNQATRAEQAGKGRRALALYTRMTTMAPGYGHAWWERARLELVDGDVPAARRSLTAMLEITRDAALREQVSAALGALSVS